MNSSKGRPVRALTVALSIATAVLGGVSHFDNAWIKSTCISSYYEPICTKPYEMCYIPEIENCPKIETERYFVAMVFLCCVLSLTFWVLDLAGKHKKVKTIDTGYHIITPIPLIIAAILYFISADQINRKAGENQARQINLRYSEKLAAAGLTILQSLLYAVLACYIY